MSTLTAEEFYFTVDKRQFKTSRRTMLGWEIKNAANLPHTWRLSRENADGPDTYVSDVEDVNVSDQRFHSEPQGITHG